MRKAPQTLIACSRPSCTPGVGTSIFEEPFVTISHLLIGSVAVPSVAAAVNALNEVRRWRFFRKVIAPVLGDGNYLYRIESDLGKVLGEGEGG